MAELRANDSEEWRTAPGYSGKLEASSLGRVRWSDGSRLPQSTRNGYPVVRIETSTRSIHRIVCETFHGPCPEGHEVAHRDGTRTNNRAINLRWATHRDNLDDMLRTRVRELPDLEAILAKIPSKQLRQKFLTALTGRPLAEVLAEFRSLARLGVIKFPLEDAA